MGKRRVAPLAIWISPKGIATFLAPFVFLGKFDNYYEIHASCWEHWKKPSTPQPDVNPKDRETLQNGIDRDKLRKTMVSRGYMRTPRIILSAMLSLFFMLVGCREQPAQPIVISKSKALELAKQEFVRTGRKIDEYRISVENDSSDSKWAIWFELKTEYALPGSRHLVTVDKKTGRTLFLQGE